MSRYWAISCILLTATTACEPPAEVPTALAEGAAIVAADVHAERLPGGVRVTNAGNAAISLYVVNTQWLGLLLPCNDSQSQCTHLRKGARVVVPNEQIYGLSDTADLVVHYWRPGDEQPTEIPVTQP